MGREWTGAAEIVRSHGPQFYAIARQQRIYGNALFDTPEVRLWRRHESYNGKRYWPLSWTIEPCRQASVMASWAVRLEHSVRSMIWSRSWV